MNDSVFGEAPDAEHKPELKIRWPLRALNSIEGEIDGLMGEAMQLLDWRAPPIFIEDGEFMNVSQYEAIYGETLTVHEAIAMQAIIYGPVQERFRRQLIIARECDGTWPDYLLRCEAEGIEPILKRNTT